MSYELLIDPRIELIGVIEYFADPITSDKVFKTVSNPIEREYQQRMISHFEKYKEHPAVGFYKTLKQNGLTPETTIRLLLYHSQVPYLFSQPVIQNQKHLEWIQLLRGWVEETKFIFFLEKNQSALNQILDRVELQISQAPLCDVIELFFGEYRKSYHIYPSPLKPGNYNVFLPNQGLAVIIGCPLLNEETLYNRVIFEFAYGFIKPAVDLNWTLLQPLEAIFKTRGKREVVYELITQSVLSILTAQSLEKNALMQSIITLISQEFQHRREIYPTFASFIPRIAELTRELLP